MFGDLKMCGIAGIISADALSLGRRLQDVCDRMSHRGPDDEGFLSCMFGQRNPPSRTARATDEAGNLFLGHRRLSIIDLAGTRQPLGNENGEVWTVFNGEIYNYAELAAELSSKRHILREKGDTEILVHLWEEFGEGMLEKLVGMFAFAIFDSGKETLFLARDRFGQKPLYYSMPKKGLFIFASELDALRHSNLCSENINNNSIARFLRYGYIPSPETVYSDIHSLPPGHCLVYKNGNISIRKYWKPSVRGENFLDIEKVRCLIDESVRLRLRSDVPFGIFLSSGIDSALIAESMKRQSPGTAKSFTISTGGNCFDESEGARLSAEHIGTEHHQIMVNPDFVSSAEKLCAHFGQPFADHSSVLTYYVSKGTREHVTVALGGDGGDELFAGYPAYFNLGKYAAISMLPGPLRILLAKFAGTLGRNSESPGRIFDSIMSAANLPGKGEEMPSLFHSYWRKICLNPEFAREVSGENELHLQRFRRYYGEAESDDPVERWLEADQRLYLADDILVKVDISSMAVSLECRSPYLDHRLAEYVNSVRLQDKIGSGIPKKILREIAASALPPETLRRPKKGFSMPFGRWMRRDLKDWIHSTIFDDPDLWKPYFRECEIRRIWNQHQSCEKDHQGRLWILASLCLWHKHCARPPAKPSSR